MKHKWIVMLVVAVACVLLPAAVLAEMSWGDFVGAVDAMTQGATGQVVYELGETEVVENASDTDEALFVPEGVQLVLRGGWFGEMRLGGGDIVLEKVTVSSQREEWAAIYFPPNGNKKVEVKLTIDKDTVIESLGYNGDGLGAWDLYGGDTSITIINHGVIASDGMGARLLLTNMGKGKSASLAFYNDGEVEATVTGASLQCMSGGGDADIWVHNAGIVRGERFSGIAAGSASQQGKATVSIWNAETGELYGGVAPMRLMMDSGAKGSVGTLTNLGLCSGQHGIWLATSAGAPVPMRINGIGTVEDGSRRLETHVNVDMKLTLKKAEKPPKEEEFMKTVTPWLEQLGVAELPQEIQIRTALSTVDAEDVQGFFYERHVSGGGKGQAEPPLHALPPGMDAWPEARGGDDD